MASFIKGPTTLIVASAFLWSSSPSLTACAYFLATSRKRSMYTRPLSVSSTLVVSRSKMRKPASFSAVATCLLKVDCVMNSRSAAWLKLRQSARTTSSLQYEMSMASPQVVFPSRASPRLRGSMIHDRRPLWLRTVDRGVYSDSAFPYASSEAARFRPLASGYSASASGDARSSFPFRRILFYCWVQGDAEGGARRCLPHRKTQGEGNHHGKEHL